MTKLNNQTGEAEGLIYDVFGQLKSHTRSIGTTAVAIEYLTDGERKRVSKRRNGVVIQKFVYNQFGQMVGELSGGNTLVSQFVYATHGHSPDYMIRSGVQYRFVKDQLGSIRLVVNAASGAIAQRMDYDEFGVVLSDSNPGFQPFGFAGGHYDHDTGLVRFGARDYDAYTGRWTSKDPILFAGGYNLFEYAKSDPVNYYDPDGQKPTLRKILGLAASVCVAYEIAKGLDNFLEYRRIGNDIDMSQRELDRLNSLRGSCEDTELDKAIALETQKFVQLKKERSKNLLRDTLSDAGTGLMCLGIRQAVGIPK